ncbi:MAG: type IV secretory system conjugative DNA transfer family protein [Chthoniobacterales bacterium]
MKKYPTQITPPFNPWQDEAYTTPLHLGNLKIKPVDLLAGTLVTGATGSGKTRSLVLPLIDKVVGRFGNAPDEKAAMIVIDAKADMNEHISELFKNSPRQSDIYTLGPNGNCWFDLFDHCRGSANQAAEFLFDLLESYYGAGNRGGNNDSFWEENARRLLVCSCIVAKARHGSSLGSIPGLQVALQTITSIRPNDSEEEINFENENNCLLPLREMLTEGVAEDRITEKEYQHVISYCQMDILRLHSKTWGIISNMTRNYLSRLNVDAFTKLFCEHPGAKRITPEAIIDEGLILIINFSPVLFQSVAEPFARAVKRAICTRILQRAHLVKEEGNAIRYINQQRPVLFVMDEFHTTLTPGGRGNEAFFLDRCREFRCMTILATQSIEAIRSQMPNEAVVNHLINNCRSKFFFNTTCPTTRSYIRTMVSRCRRPNIAWTYVARAPKPMFRLPNYISRPSPALTVQSCSTSQEYEKHFDADQILGNLDCGQALAILGKGEWLKYCCENFDSLLGIQSLAESPAK